MNYTTRSRNGISLDVYAYGAGKMHVVLISEEDLPKICALKGPIWVKKNNRSGKYYAMCWHNGKPIALHRYLTDCPEGMEVDHINGYTLDNTRFNIRVVTHKQNMNWKKNAITEIGYPKNYQTNVAWTNLLMMSLTVEFIEKVAEEGWTA